MLLASSFSSIAPRSSNGVTIAGWVPTTSHYCGPCSSCSVLKLRYETGGGGGRRLVGHSCGVLPSAPKKCSLAAFKVRPTGWPGRELDIGARRGRPP